MSMINRLMCCSDIKRFTAVCYKLFNDLDFDRVYLGSSSQDLTTGKTNFPDLLLSDYKRGEFEKVDYVLRHSRSRTAWLFNQDSRDYCANSPMYSEDNERNLDMFDLFEKYNLRCVLNIPIETPVGCNFLVSLGREGDYDPVDFKRECENSRDVIQILAENVSYAASVKYQSFFFKPYFKGKGTSLLTDKQLQLLTTLAKSNKTLQSAADAMCISLDTANKHIAAAKSALGAKTQATAVYRAVVAGLIDLSCDNWSEGPERQKKSETLETKSVSSPHNVARLRGTEH